MLGLLLDPAGRCVAVELGDSETLGVVNFFEENARAALLAFEFVDRLADVAFDQIVAQDYAHLIPIRKVFGETERLRDATFAFLIGVVQVLEAEALSIAEQTQKVARVAPSRDQQNVGDPRVDQGLNGIVDHRLVVDGQQMFIGDFGERKQPAAGAACEDDAFHDVSITSTLKGPLHARVARRVRYFSGPPAGPMLP